MYIHVMHVTFHVMGKWTTQFPSFQFNTFFFHSNITGLIASHILSDRWDWVSYVFSWIKSNLFTFLALFALGLYKAAPFTCCILHLYASSNIFLIIRHLADSVNPTISSGEQIFTNGKSEDLASWAARADLPALGAPSIKILEIHR